MMQMMSGLMVAGAVSALARLGVPDFLEAGPQTAEELAPKVGAQAVPLFRLMRATASVGVLVEGADRKFSQTPLSAVLCTNAKPSLRGWAIMLSQEWHVRGWDHLEYCVRTGKQAMDDIYGKSAFEWDLPNPDAAGIFNQAMTDLSMLDSPGVAEALSLEGIGTLVDVAGGHGLLLATILGRNPGLKGVLYEIGQVIEGAKTGPLVPYLDRCRRWWAGICSRRCLRSADAYIMKHIIHDWPDELCLKILKGCRAGVKPGRKLLVVDDSDSRGQRFPSGQSFLDLEMLIFPGGQARTEQQFRDFVRRRRGGRLTRVIPTQERDFDCGGRGSVGFCTKAGRSCREAAWHGASQHIVSLHVWEWKARCRSSCGGTATVDRDEMKIRVEEKVTACIIARDLLDNFGKAVHAVLVLHEEQFLAIVEGDAEAGRFDLLIHEALEHKQNTKYAYLMHLDRHGCSLQTYEESDTRGT